MKDYVDHLVGVEIQSAHLETGRRGIWDLNTYKRNGEIPVVKMW